MRQFDLEEVVAEQFLRRVSERFPGSSLYFDQEVGMVLVRAHDFAQSCEAGVELADRDADGFVCVRVDSPSDCNGGRIVWYRRWNDDENEKLAEFFRIHHHETQESWADFCETWDIAQEEAMLPVGSIPRWLADEAVKFIKAKLQKGEKV